MSRFMVALLLVAAIAYTHALPTTTTNQTCGPNEQFTYCGTACPPKCGMPTPQICTLQCVQECQCREGYIRSSEGSCISLVECANSLR